LVGFFGFDIIGLVEISKTRVRRAEAWRSRAL